MKALREKEARYRGLFEDSPISLWEEDFSELKNYFAHLRSKGVTDFEGFLDSNPDEVQKCASFVRVLDVNKATVEMLRAGSKDELLGKLDTLLDADSAGAFKKELLALAAGKRLFETEITGRTLEGKRIHLNLRMSIAPGYENTWSKVFVSLTDITRRRLAEEALEFQKQELARSNADLEQFANVASHDLQEPLRMVSSYVRLLERKYAGKLDSDADEFIRFAVEGVTRMQRLISDLLMYSQVGSKGMDIRAVSCEDVLEQTLASMFLAIEENQALVTHDPLPTVKADDMQLSRLFQNLIGNAIKFRREQPPVIHVSAERQDGEWIFAVRDNGLGIESQYFERVFAIFQRLHGRQHYPGTGIGLAICKRIVERHQGNIWVESEPGKGSTFYFSLPS